MTPPSIHSISPLPSIHSISPDGAHKVVFHNAGEFRSGPPYYNVSIDGKFIDNRVFGDLILWDTESRYIAFQEWRSTIEKDGPKTALTLYDTSNQKFAMLSMVDGFIRPLRFEDNRIIYKKEFIGASVGEYEIHIDNVSNWTK